MIKQPTRFRAVVALTMMSISGLASAADDFLVRSPEMVLVRADFDADLTRVPAEQRVAFATSPQRVQAVINSLVVNRTLAERARTLGLANDPVVQRRLLLESERALAALMLERIEGEAGAEFDRAAERNLARARELYLINRAKYLLPEEVDVSHILFDTTKRGKEAALAAATDARAKLLAGASFGALALTLSDDPSVQRNKGRLEWGPRGRYEPEFDAAAFALKAPGDISEPVYTRYGYHLIKLEGRNPPRQLSFDDVSDKILVELRQKHIAEAREATVASIRADKRLQVNQEALDALVVKIEVPPIPASGSGAGKPAAAPPPK